MAKSGSKSGQTTSLALSLLSVKKSTIGARGVAMAIAEMCEHNILPCTPFVDIGFDIVSVHQSVLKRVQVKSTSIDPAKTNGRFEFCVKRRKDRRRYDNNNTSFYPDDFIDAFIFVHTKLRLFFVIPAAKIASRHKISFLLDSPWRDAWDVLKS